MRSWQFIQLFHRIFGPASKLDSAEIEQMGLLAVKIAQMYAIRGDLLGPEKTSRLSRLYEQASPMPTGAFQRRFEELAPPALLRDIAHLDQAPLAVASLGQVHRARLHSGQQVVVKLLRDDHASSFHQDVAAVRALAQCAVFFYPPLTRLADPLGTLAAIERTTQTEMDLTAEIRGTRKLEKLRDEGKGTLPHLERLKFPRVFEDYTTPSILVSEWVEAPSVRKLLAEQRFTYENLLLLFRIHGYFLFFRGRFHGDFHPGNLHFDGENFWWIDNANVEEAEPRFTQGLLDFMVALGERDHDAAARALEGLAQEPFPDPEPFRLRFRHLYANFGDQPVGKQSLTKQMMATIRMAVESGLQFPEGAFPVIKSLMYLDGMAIQSAPDQYLLRDVARFASDFKNRSPS